MLISNRTQALGLELFRNLGIEPTERKLVVVKSTNHFMAAFGPIAQKVIYVDSEGPLNRDYRKIPYTVQRPIWPLDADDVAGPDRVTPPCDRAPCHFEFIPTGNGPTPSWMKLCSHCHTSESIKEGGGGGGGLVSSLFQRSLE